MFGFFLSFILFFFLAALYSCLGTSCALTPAGRQPQGLNTSERRRVRPCACGPPPAAWPASLCQSTVGPPSYYSLEYSLDLLLKKPIWKSRRTPMRCHTDLELFSLMLLCDVTESTAAHRRLLTKGSGKDVGGPRPTEFCASRLWRLQLSTVIWLNRACTFQRAKMTSARMSRPIRTLMMMIQIGIPPKVSFETWIFTC